MEGIFRSEFTGRLYEFVRWAADVDVPVIIGMGVLDKEEYRVPYKNLSPATLDALRVATEKA